MKLMLLFLFQFVLISDAYVPKLHTLMTHIAGNNGGQNGLIIHRSVFFKEENLASNETWYISHADAMKVVVSGKNSDNSDWTFEVLYKGGKRQTVSTTGETKTFALSPEFFEQLLHYRSARALQGRLETLQILPQGSGAATHNSYVSLDRYKGTVVYRFGAQESKNAQPPPLFMVEQDSFVPKKLRLGSQMEIEFADTTQLDEGTVKGAIRQPTQQTILWKNTTVVAKITSMEKAPQAKINQHLKFENKRVAMPVNDNVKEFYSRFR